MSKPVYLVITPFFPEPDSFRGPYVYDQVRAIERTGEYDVMVFKPCAYNQKALDYEYEGVKVFRFKVYDLPSAILPGTMDCFSIRSMFRKLDLLGVSLGDVAVVHCHVTGLGRFANAIKKRNPQVKTLLQHHGFDVLSLENGILSRYAWHRNFVKRYGVGICNQIDLHIGVSQRTLDYVVSYPEIRMKAHYVLYNGVDTSKFYPPKEGVKNEKFTIGCIANFWPLKDQITLIKAVHRLAKEGYTSVVCRFIGTGETLLSCQEYIRNNGLDQYFTFESELFHHQLLEFYQSLDLFVLPSYWEAFGCVYTEAYACAVPFIACKGQGISELIAERDQDRWLIELQDDKKLASLIARCRDERDVMRLNRAVDIDLLVGEFVECVRVDYVGNLPK